MKNKIKQKIATVSSLILGLTFGLSNQPAHATGSRCVSFGLNLTCARVVGSGLAVNSVQGQFAINPSQNCIKNWRYRISYKDKNNKEYASINGPTNSICDYAGSFTINYTTKYMAKEGSICASLYNNNNTFISSACVPITP